MIYLVWAGMFLAKLATSALFAWFVLATDARYQRMPGYQMQIATRDRGYKDDFIREHCLKVVKQFFKAARNQEIVRWSR